MPNPFWELMIRLDKPVGAVPNRFTYQCSCKLPTFFVDELTCSCLLFATPPFPASRKLSGHRQTAPPTTVFMFSATSVASARRQLNTLLFRQLIASWFLLRLFHVEI